MAPQASQQQLQQQREELQQLLSSTRDTLERRVQQLENGWREDSAARQKAHTEEVAALKRAHAEEGAARQKAWEEELVGLKRSHEEELGACTGVNAGVATTVNDMVPLAAASLRQACWHLGAYGHVSVCHVRCLRGAEKLVLSSIVACILALHAVRKVLERNARARLQ